MTLLKKILSIFLIFLAGGVTVANLSYLRYHVPSHYHGSWIKVACACCLAIIFGIYIARGHK